MLFLFYQMLRVPGGAVGKRGREEIASIIFKPVPEEGDIKAVSEAIKITEIDYEKWLNTMPLENLESLSKIVATMTGGNLDHHIKSFMQFHPEYVALQA